MLTLAPAVVEIVKEGAVDDELDGRDLPTMDDMVSGVTFVRLVSTLDRYVDVAGGDHYITLPLMPRMLSNLRNFLAERSASMTLNEGTWRATMLARFEEKFGTLFTDLNLYIVSALLHPTECKFVRDSIDGELLDECIDYMADLALELEEIRAEKAAKRARTASSQAATSSSAASSSSSLSSPPSPRGLGKEPTIAIVTKSPLERFRETIVATIDTFTQHHEHFTKAANQFAEANKANAKAPSYALDYWRRNQENLLTPPFRLLTAISASSVPSERAFSAAGRIHTSKRHQLRSELIDDLVYIREHCINPDELDAFVETLLKDLHMEELMRLKEVADSEAEERRLVAQSQ